MFEALYARFVECEYPTPPTASIENFIGVLLQRWPDLSDDEDRDENLGIPWSTAPMLGNASGPLVYFSMVWSRSVEASAFAASVAISLGLVCFDPQMGCLRTS